MISEQTLKELSILYGHIEDEYNQGIRDYIKGQIMEHLSCMRAKIKQIEVILSRKRTVILHDYISQMEERCNEIQQIADGLEHNFMLFVMGNGCNGKSTLINVLAGKNCAEVDDKPSTWKIDTFYHNHGHDCTITFRDGTQRRMSIEQTKNYLKEEERKRKVSEKEIKNELDKLKNSGVSLEVLEEKEKELKKYSLYQSPVNEVAWPTVGSKILEKYRLVDTPGLRQELGKIVIASSSDYFAKADGVIWILPGDKASSKGDYEEIKKICTQYGKKPDNIIAVLNRIDLLRKSGIDIATVLNEAKNLYKGIFTEIVPISAKQAQMAQTILRSKECTEAEKNEGNRLWDESNISELMQLLNRTIFADAINIQIRSKVRGCREKIAAIKVSADTACNMLIDANSQREAKIKAWEKDSSEVRERFKQNLNTFTTREIERVRRETAKVEDELWDMESAERNQYIIDKIICSSSLERKLRTFFDGQVREISLIYQEHLKRAPFKEFPLLMDNKLMLSYAQNSMVSNIKILDDLSGESGGQVALGAVAGLLGAAIAGPVGMLAVGIAKTDFGRGLARSISRLFGSSMESKITKKFAGQMADLNTNLFSQYDEAIKRADVSLEEVREGTFEELYGSSEILGNIIEQLDDIYEIEDVKFEKLKLKDVLFS